MDSSGHDDNLGGFENDGLHVGQVPTGEKVCTHDLKPLRFKCDVPITECDWVTDDWETKRDVETPEADDCQENIIETTHVSLGTNDTTYCSLALTADELVEVVPADVTPTAYAKGAVELPKVNPVNGSTYVLIAVETVMYLDTKIALELVFTHVGSSTRPKNPPASVAHEVKKEIFLDEVAHPEHVPANEASLDIVLMSVRANIATTATKECIVSTDDEGTCPSLDDMMSQDPLDRIG